MDWRCPLLSSSRVCSGTTTSSNLNLSPNGVLHVYVFIHFYEAFVGIKPHYILFHKFFRLKPQPSTNVLRVVGGADIHMREDAADQ
jgi:hypothetical protein